MPPSPEPEGLPIDTGGLIRRGRFTYLPVAPGRMEFAVEVRRILLESRPKIVAVELPEFLRGEWTKAVDRLPEISVLLYESGEEEAVYVPVEPADPFTEAVRTAREIGAEVLFCDPGARERPHLPEAYADPYAIQRIGFERYIELYRVHIAEHPEEVARYAQAVAWKLQGADPFADIFAVVSLNLLDALLDAMELPQPEPKRPPGPRRLRLMNPHPDTLIEITTEYPFLAARYEESRQSCGFLPSIDRPRVQLAVLKEAEIGYQVNAGEKLAHWQRKAIARYSRNLAITDSSIVAGIYDLTLAARSIVDDNYAWEVWQAANQYPWQRHTDEPETVRLTGDQVWLDTRKLRLRRRIPRTKQLLLPRGLKQRPKEGKPGEWARSLDGDSICSYPPEDLVIESYGRFLRNHAKRLISEERSRVEPFQSSLLDGIDLRETIRRWYEGRIYVRQFENVAGEVGAVVVIFDEDAAGKYDYMTTWLGEHQNESDMAFYASNPFQHTVGPGIGRAEYGGFVMTLPSRRMFDIWSDPDYALAETKAEVLLLAGLDYSVDRYVVYVAARPPRSIFRTIAARMNRKILYIPIGQLSAERLKKIRVVHVLDGYDKRAQAKDYIW